MKKPKKANVWIVSTGIATVFAVQVIVLLPARPVKPVDQPVEIVPAPKPIRGGTPTNMIWTSTVTVRHK